MSFSSGLVSCADVEGRSDEAGLLGAEPDEPHLVDRLDPQLRHLERDLELHRRSGAVVVDARPLDHGVEVRAGDDDPVGPTAVVSAITFSDWRTSAPCSW